MWGLFSCVPLWRRYASTVWWTPIFRFFLFLSLYLLFFSLHVFVPCILFLFVVVIYFIVTRIIFLYTFLLSFFIGKFFSYSFFLSFYGFRSFSLNNILAIGFLLKSSTYFGISYLTVSLLPSATYAGTESWTPRGSSMEGHTWCRMRFVDERGTVQFSFLPFSPSSSFWLYIFGCLSLLLFLDYTYFIHNSVFVFQLVFRSFSELPRSSRGYWSCKCCNFSRFTLLSIFFFSDMWGSSKALSMV